MVPEVREWCYFVLVRGSHLVNVEKRSTNSHENDTKQLSVMLDAIEFALRAHCGREARDPITPAVGACFRSG